MISDVASIGRRDICLFSDPPSTEIYEGNSTIEMFNILNRMYVWSLRQFGGKVREIFNVSDWGVCPMFGLSIVLVI